MLKLNFICIYDFNKKTKFGLNNPINFKHIYIFKKIMEKNININLNILKNNKKQLMLIKSPFHYKYSKHILFIKNNNLSIKFYIKNFDTIRNFNVIKKLLYFILKNNFINYPSISIKTVKISYVQKVDKNFLV